VSGGRQLRVGHTERRPDASRLDSGIRGVASRAHRVRPVPDADVRVAVRADRRTPRPQRQPRLRGRRADGHVRVRHGRPPGAGHSAGEQAASRAGRSGRRDTGDGRDHRRRPAGRVPVLERRGRAALRPDTHATRVLRLRRRRPVQRFGLPDRQLGPAGPADGRGLRAGRDSRRLCQRTYVRRTRDRLAGATHRLASGRSAAGVATVRGHDSSGRTRRRRATTTDRVQRDRPREGDRVRQPVSGYAVEVVEFRGKTGSGHQLDGQRRVRDKALVGSGSHGGWPAECVELLVGTRMRSRFWRNVSQRHRGVQLGDTQGLGVGRRIPVVRRLVSAMGARQYCGCQCRSFCLLSQLSRDSDKYYTYHYSLYVYDITIYR